MKRLIIFMLIIVAMISGKQYANAQEGSLAIGVAGVMSSELLTGDNESIRYYGGVELFANYRYDLSSRFFILPEVAISQRWHKNNYDSDVIFTASPYIDVEQVRAISSAIALRPNFGIYVAKGNNWNLGITTGPEMDWIFSQSHKNKFINYEPQVPIESIHKYYEKKVQWGWNFGICADIQKIRFGVSYLIGIGDMKTKFETDKPNELRISIGYRF